MQESSSETVPAITFPDRESFMTFLLLLTVAVWRMASRLRDDIGETVVVGKEEVPEPGLATLWDPG